MIIHGARPVLTLARTQFGCIREGESLACIDMELQSVVASSKAATLRDKARSRRKRDALVLVSRFLADLGYTASQQALSSECGISLDRYDCADNMDMLTILKVCLAWVQLAVQ